MPFQGYGVIIHIVRQKDKGFLSFFIHRFMSCSVRQLSALHEVPHRGILEEKGRNRYVAYSERAHSPDYRR